MRRQNSVLPLPWPIALSCPVSSILSGDQMTLSPGPSGTSRIFSPPGSFQRTRRLIQSRGSVTPNWPATLRGCGSTKSSCCDIADPLLHILRQAADGRAEFDAFQEEEHESRPILWPPSGIYRVKAGTNCPGMPIQLLNGPANHAMLAYRCSPRSVVAGCKCRDRLWERIRLRSDNASPLSGDGWRR